MSDREVLGSRNVPRWRWLRLDLLTIVQDREPYYHDGAWWFVADNYQQEFGPFGDHVAAKLECDNYHMNAGRDERARRRDPNQ